MISTKARFRITVVFLTLVSLTNFSSLSGQTSADRLYLAIQQLQIELGESAVADEVRDQYLVRELETESARGFSGDPNVFRQAAMVLKSQGNLQEGLARVQSALDEHIAVLDVASSVELQSALVALEQDLEPVTLYELLESSDSVIAALQAQDKFHEADLSIYGRYYINNYLELPKLITRLGDFDYLPAGDPDQEFNRELNNLRGELRTARLTFAYKATDYPNLYIDRSERAIASFEQQITAYLVAQTTRALTAFEEDRKPRTRLMSELGFNTKPSSRLYHAELGRLLGLLRDRGHGAGFDALIRQQLSLPNLKVTVNEAWANRAYTRSVNEIQDLDEVILGSRAQGYTIVDGSVTFDFIENMYSANVRVNLDASTSSSAYTKEGPVTAYTSTTGVLAANREISANIGNVSVLPVTAWASLQSEFRGTDCLPIVDRIAFNMFSQKKAPAEQISSDRAKNRVEQQFTQQTDEALNEGLSQMETARGRRFELLAEINRFRRTFSEVLSENEDGKIEGPVDMIDPFAMPRLFVTTSGSELNIGGILEGDNRLAATSPPPGQTVPVDVRLQVHESLLSNAAAPFVQDRLFQNWQFARLVESLSSGQAELPQPKNNQRWAIRFDDGRPVQVAFENHELIVTVYGKEFRREGGRVAPLNIVVRTRVVNDAGKLKLLRIGNAVAEFTYPPAEGKTLNAEDIAFRQFLQDNLNEALAVDPMEEAIELPDNLLLLNLLNDQRVTDFLKDAVLVECTAEGGWLTLGWNFTGSQSGHFQPVNTPAIWNDAMAAPDEPVAETND